ncbi:hypothetical protein D3C78_200290 [compost metagenome]
MHVGLGGGQLQGLRAVAGQVDLGGRVPAQRAAEAAVQHLEEAPLEGEAGLADHASGHSEELVDARQQVGVLRAVTEPAAQVGVRHAADLPGEAVAGKALEADGVLRRVDRRTAGGVEFRDQFQAPCGGRQVAGEYPGFVAVRGVADADAVEPGELGRAGDLVQVVEEVEAVAAGVADARAEGRAVAGQALAALARRGVGIAPIAVVGQLPDEFAHVKGSREIGSGLEARPLSRDKSRERARRPMWLARGMLRASARGERRWAAGKAAGHVAALLAGAQRAGERLQPGAGSPARRLARARRRRCRHRYTTGVV